MAARNRTGGVMKANLTGFRASLRAAAIITGVGMFSSAQAGYPAVTLQQRLACTPDVFRLCSSQIPHVGEIIACMLAKKASLSPGCRAVFDQALAKKTAAQE
jgi:hypothetical protein